MILDEATANIDTETELFDSGFAGKDAVRRHDADRRAPAVTIQHADNIIVLSHGKIRRAGEPSGASGEAANITSCTRCNIAKEQLEGGKRCGAAATMPPLSAWLPPIHGLLREGHSGGVRDAAPCNAATPLRFPGTHVY